MSCLRTIVIYKKKCCFNESASFSEIYCQTSFQESKLSGALITATLHVCGSTMLLLKMGKCGLEYKGKTFAFSFVKIFQFILNCNGTETPNNSSISTSALRLIAMFLVTHRIVRMFQGRSEATDSQQQDKCAAKSLGPQGVGTPRISRQSVHEGCNVIRTTHWPTLPSRRYPFS